MIVNVPSQSYSPCGICFEDKNPLLDPAGSLAWRDVCEGCSSICVICCSRHIRAYLESGPRISIPCVFKKQECTWDKHVLTIIHKQSSNSELTKGLTSIELNACVRSSRMASNLQKPNFRWCQKPDCGDTFLGSVESPRMQCSSCACWTCFNHEVDHPGESCLEFDNRVQMQQERERQEALKQQRERGDQLLEQCVEVLTKQCPKCNVRIEKNGGCSHMTCTLCSHDFFWCCLRAYRDPDQARAHRQSC